MYKGGCLCGRVACEISGEIGDIVYCHCSQCRKARGSAFATNGNVEVEKFRFVCGQGELTGYESSFGRTKYFCRHCGSPIRNKDRAISHYVRVRLGTIEPDMMERPQVHIFVSSKANREEIGAELLPGSEKTAFELDIGKRILPVSACLQLA